MRSVVIAVIISMVTVGSGAVWAQEAADWRTVAESIPLGTRVRVQTIEGKRFSGTLMRVDSNVLLVKKNTRHPEPAVLVSFDDVTKLERQKEGGIHLGKAMAVGAATAAGAMLTIILFALQLD
jgi:hypothetical protein